MSEASDDTRRHNLIANFLIFWFLQSFCPSSAMFHELWKEKVTLLTQNKRKIKNKIMGKLLCDPEILL